VITLTREWELRADFPADATARDPEGSSSFFRQHDRAYQGIPIRRCGAFLDPSLSSPFGFPGAKSACLRGKPALIWDAKK
jgi:hypothetical protein